MKRKHLIIGIGVLLALVLLFQLPSPTKQLTSNPSATQITAKEREPSSNTEEAHSGNVEKVNNLVGAVESMLSTPIVFHGVVVDQYGNPVANAKVRYSLLDKFNASGSGGGTSSDHEGRIEISGVRGAVLGVNVSKNGYYQIHGVSNQRFAYGYGTDDYTKPTPSKGKPAVFVLHKVGRTEPLVELSSRQFHILDSEQPTIINLVTGQSIEPGLQISSRVGEKTEEGRYDWRYELYIRGGGLVERNGQFDFEAPVNGYESRIVIEAKSSDPEWRNGAEKSYFVRLADNTHARIQARFYPRDYRNIVVLGSYLNPDPGSRNLEYDPEKQIKP